MGRRELGRNLESPERGTLGETCGAGAGISGGNLGRQNRDSKVYAELQLRGAQSGPRVAGVPGDWWGGGNSGGISNRRNAELSGKLAAPERGFLAETWRAKTENSQETCGAETRCSRTSWGIKTENSREIWGAETSSILWGRGRSTVSSLDQSVE